MIEVDDLDDNFTTVFVPDEGILTNQILSFEKTVTAFLKGEGGCDQAVWGWDLIFGVQEVINFDTLWDGYKMKQWFDDHLLNETGIFTWRTLKYSSQYGLFLYMKFALLSYNHDFLKVSKKSRREGFHCPGNLELQYSFSLVLGNLFQDTKIGSSLLQISPYLIP